VVGLRLNRVNALVDLMLSRLRWYKAGMWRLSGRARHRCYSLALGLRLTLRASCLCCPL
jgi:hypothetical protein